MNEVKAMPNWCHNVVEIEGKDVVEKFKRNCSKVDEDGEYALDFDKVMPQPLWVVETLSYGSKEAHIWYEWRLDNWGTKWNACECVVDFTNDNTGLVIAFDTAWNAPSIDLVREIMRATDAERVCHVFCEEGAEFYGSRVYTNNQFNGIDCNEYESEDEAKKYFDFIFEDYNEDDDEEDLRGW